MYIRIALSCANTKTRQFAQHLGIYPSARCRMRHEHVRKAQRHDGCMFIVVSHVPRYSHDALGGPVRVDVGQQIPGCFQTTPHFLPTLPTYIILFTFYDYYLYIYQSHAKAQSGKRMEARLEAAMEGREEDGEAARRAKPSRAFDGLGNDRSLGSGGAAMAGQQLEDAPLTRHNMINGDDET